MSRFFLTMAFYNSLYIDKDSILKSNKIRPRALFLNKMKIKIKNLNSNFYSKKIRKDIYFFKIRLKH